MFEGSAVELPNMKRNVNPADGGVTLTTCAWSQMEKLPLTSLCFKYD